MTVARAVETHHGDHACATQIILYDERRLITRYMDIRETQESKSRKKREAGRRGGLATLARHGKEYMREIGKKGAKVFHLRYRLEPVNLNDFAVVHRETGEIKAYLSGLPLK
jgi:hypothetical protein